MDGNPLGQSGDISLDDQDTPRTDYNNPAKVNDHEVESRMWVSAPLTKQKKEDISKYEKFFCGLPKGTIEKTFEATTRLGRIITGETLWLRNALKAPNPALNVKRRNEPVAMDTIHGPVGHPAIAHRKHARLNFSSVGNPTTDPCIIAVRATKACTGALWMTCGNSGPWMS